MMEKTNNRDGDAIRKWMQEEGVLHTSPDFTGRLMKKVHQVPAYSLGDYKPLIGARGWIIISLCVLMLVVCCILVLATGNDASTGYLDFMGPVFAYFRNLTIGVNINFGTVLIGSMVFLSIAILLSVDFVFNTKISLE